MNRTTAYGLTFLSELSLPEFMVSPDAAARADVTIRLGTVPEHLDQATGSGVLFDTTKTEFLLRVPNVARYLVRNGDEIIVQDTGAADEHEIRVFMLGSALGALLHQRQQLVLHAAAIGNESGAYLLAGTSGVGKSTLLGELLGRGHSMMVDDVCAVQMPADGHPQVLSGYPRTRLWADAAEHLEVDTSQLPRTRASLEKFEVQLPDRFWAQHAPLRRIYILSTHNASDFGLEQLPKVQSFAMILAHTYRRRFMSEMEMSADHFSIATAVAAKTSIVQVTRPIDGYQLEALADLIEADIATAALSS